MRTTPKFVRKKYEIPCFIRIHVLLRCHVVITCTKTGWAILRPWSKNCALICIFFSSCGLCIPYLCNAMACLQHVSIIHGIGNTFVISLPVSNEVDIKTASLKIVVVKRKSSGWNPFILCFWILVMHRITIKTRLFFRSHSRVRISGQPVFCVTQKLWSFLLFSFL